MQFRWCAFTLLFWPAVRLLSAPIAELPDYTTITDSDLEGTLLQDGSGSMDNLVKATTREFMRLYPRVECHLGFGSSAVVPPALLESRINLGAMSRTMSPGEREEFQKKFGHPPMEIRVARDALEVLVNASNPIKQLTLRQLDAVFGTNRRRGALQDVATWGQLGLSEPEWINRPIQLWGGATGWGTTRTFQQLVLLDGEFKDTVQVADIMTGVAQKVGEDRGAIGYAVVRDRSAAVRALPIAANDSEPYVHSTPENILNGRYPLQRTLYFYVNTGPAKPLAPVVREYLRFVLSRQGQELIEQEGYVPLNPAVARRDRMKLESRHRAD